MHLRSPTLRCLVIASSLLPLLGCGGDDSVGTLRLETCTVAGVPEPAQCGRFTVLENPDAPAGRRLALRVVVLPALTPRAEPDPIVFVDGGPGAAATERAAGLALRFHDARRKRDIVLVDVRGTGDSNPLWCPDQTSGGANALSLGQVFAVDALPACRAALAERADLAHYTTSHIVDDLDALREALGHPQVNVIAVSYGTRVALDYLRRHPERVRSATLQGVVSTDAAMPAAFARDSHQALAALFDACTADPACRRHAPDPWADLETALGRFDDGPVTVSVEAPTGIRTVVLDRPTAAHALRYLQYRSRRAFEIPALLRTTAEGDLQPLAVFAEQVAGELQASIPDGLYLSVTCAEDVPFVTDSDLHEAEDAYLGTQRIARQRAACQAWQQAQVADAFRQPVSSDTPVLLLSGARDPVTPPTAAERVAQSLPNSRHVVVPHTAHNLSGLRGSACIDQLIARFVHRADVERLDVERCLAAIEPPPFPPFGGHPSTREAPAGVGEALRGRWQGESEDTVLEIVGDPGSLRLRAGDDDVSLRSIGGGRFVIDEAPPGTYLTIHRPDASDPAARMDFVQAGYPALSLRKTVGPDYAP